MEEVEGMAVSVHERVAEATEIMETAMYAALEAIDSYGAVVRGIIDEQSKLDEPNAMLVKRMGQFSDRANTMVSVIEDEVLDHLNSCRDRLFSVKMAEEGTFI
jgi:hypothetical protein